MPFVYPDNTLDFAGQLPVHDVEGRRASYEADPVLARALDVLFILHADHEQNCGTTAMRVVGSRHADPYSLRRRGRRRSTARATAAPTRQVIRMLTEIGSIDNVDGFIDDVKARQGPAAGLRPPRLQELRPAGHDHQEDRRTRSSRSPARTRCSTSP